MPVHRDIVRAALPAPGQAALKPTVSQPHSQSIVEATQKTATSASMIDANAPDSRPSSLAMTRLQGIG